MINQREDVVNSLPMKLATNCIYSEFIEMLPCFNFIAHDLSHW